MPDSYVFKNVVTLVDGFDFSTKFNQAAMAIEVANLNKTVFGDDTVVGKSGLISFGLDYGGFFETDDDDAENIDKEFFNGQGTNRIISLIPEGNTVDNDAYILEAVQTAYSHGGTVGDLLAFTFGAASRSKPTKATLKIPLTSRAASFTGTKTQVGALSATQEMVAIVHCTAFDGATVDVDIRSDADASAGGETVRGSFTQLTDVGSQRIVIAGAITDEYWDVDVTFSGTSFSLAVLIGIQTIHIS